jgi:hypothetical protein
MTPHPLRLALNDRSGLIGLGLVMVAIPGVAVLLGILM